METKQEFYRAKEAAAFLRVSEATVFKWVREGILPKGFKVAGGRITVWPRDVLLALVDCGQREKGA